MIIHEGKYMDSKKLGIICIKILRESVFRYITYIHINEQLYKRNYDRPSSKCIKTSAPEVAWKRNFLRLENYDKPTGIYDRPCIQQTDRPTDGQIGS